MNSAITNGSYNMSFIAPSNQEETDTRMLLHAKDASQSGIKKVPIYAVDVVSISIGLFGQLDLLKLWLAIGTGNHLRHI